MRMNTPVGRVLAFLLVFTALVVASSIARDESWNMILASVAAIVAAGGFVLFCWWIGHRKSPST